MKTVIKDTKVYFNGMSQLILAGTEYKDDAAIVVAKPALFVEVEGKKAPVAAPKKAPKKVEKKVEEPKEELLVEAPVAPLEVEVKEEIVEEETPTKVKKGRKKKGFFTGSDV